MTPDRQRASEDHKRAEVDHQHAAKERRRIDRLNKFRTSPIGVMLFYGYLIAIMVTAGFVGSVMLSNRTIAKRALSASSQATRALCNQSRAAHFRLKTALDFKKEHPRGTADFSVALINRSIANARAEIKANEDVKCP